LVNKNKAQKAQAVFYATQARDNAPHYEHSHIGYNYRMSNVLAGIGRGQMLVLDDRVAARRRNYEFYVQELGSLLGFDFVSEPEEVFSNRWLSTVLINEEKAGITPTQLREALERENIETRPLWKPMHLQPVFKQYAYYGGTIAQDLFKNGLCLPSGSNLTSEDLDRVVTAIKKTVVAIH